MKKDVVSPEEIDDLMIMFGEMNSVIVDNAQKIRLPASELHSFTKIAEDTPEEEAEPHPFEEISDQIERKINELESILEKVAPVKEGAKGSKIFACLAGPIP